MIGPLIQLWAKEQDPKIAVLCSVIEWKGSVPRKDFPLMLVLEDGRTLGTIGGGSMELKVTRSALEMMGQTTANVFDFDMSGTDVQADLGLCGGTLKVLVEPFTEDLQKFYADLNDQMSEYPETMVLLSFSPFQTQGVQRNLIQHAQDLAGPEPETLERLRQMFKRRKTSALTEGDTHFLLWQPFSPPALHIFGAGHVGQAVAQLTHLNDIVTHVYDDRRELLTSERFPHATRHDTQFPMVWDKLPLIPGSDFVLIASREHKHDGELLAGLLQTPREYVGLVSSTRKWELLSRSLLAAGIPAEVLARVHAPVGLGIEAETVPEIAISIMAEIIAQYRKRKQ